MNALPALLLASAFALLAPAASQAQTFDDVRARHRPSETLFLDRHGEPVARLRTDHRVRRGDWVPLADISPALRQALVLSEDKRFYEHSGVDWRAVSAAAWGNLWHTRTRGASTLTMQLAGLLDDDLRRSTGGRSWRQKIGQAAMARRLEQHWRKNEILEAYLNLVPFRGELVGMDALARTLLAKAPHGLNDHEAAMAAALVRAPNAAPAVISRRACGVLRAMRGGPADCVALDMQVELSLARRAWPAAHGIAPHYARRLLAAWPADRPTPHEIHTTLDARLQRLALQGLQQQIRELEGSHVEDGAVIVLDNASGEVLAWVGSSGELSGAAEVDAVTARRQPGSALKPFLYAQAMAERRLTAASLLHDSPAHLQTASGLYIPKNYDLSFKGWVSARTALASSLNVPTVRTIVMVSPRAFHKQLAAFGITLPESGDYYGYSLALGSSEVTLLQLANAYRALANGGIYCPLAQPLIHSSSAQNPDKSESNPACNFAIDAGAAFITADILADRTARALTFGTDSILATRFWSAVKTGTSKDMRDNWALGFTGRHTVGVWVGNASGAPMWDVSGTSGAAPVWAALMQQLHRQAPSPAPVPPPELIRTAVRFGDGLEAGRMEWFLPGTEQILFALDPGTDAVTAMKTTESDQPRHTQALADVSPRITAPQDGTIIALDPDIPPTHQRLMLRADAGGALPDDLRWQIGEAEVGQGTRAGWLPWPGRHFIRLTDTSGTVHDERRIEVRGAQAHTPAPSS